MLKNINVDIIKGKKKNTVTARAGKFFWSKRPEHIAGRYWPVILFVAVPLIILLMVLFSGKVPFPTSYIANDLGPWSKYTSSWPIKNGIPDVPGEIFPMKSLVIDLWKNGTVPLWNPFVFSGNPLLANFQSAVFFPLNILFLIFPKMTAWSFLVMLQPVLAGLFTYLFGRSLGLKKISATVAGIAFMFCGFMTVWNTYLSLGFTILFLPLALFIIEKYYQTRQKFILPILTLVLSVSFFSGHIQTWSYLFGGVTLYTFVRELLNHEQKDYRSFVWCLFYLFLTIPLVAIQLFPTWEFYSLTGRSQSVLDVKSAGIPLAYLVTFFSPDFFGNPVTRNDWFGTYAEWSSHIGLTAAVFALAGLSFLRRERKFWPVFVLFLAGFFLSVHTPVLELIVGLPLPVLKNSNPARAIVLVSFALSVVAGFGFETFLSVINSKRRVILAAVSVSIILISLLFVVIVAGIFNLPGAENLKMISLRNLFYSFTILGFFWLLLVLFSVQKFKKTVVILMLLLMLGEMLRFYFKWTPFDPARFFYPDNKVSGFLSSGKNYARYYGQFNQAPANYYHWLSTEGYEPLNLKSYTDLLSSSKTGQTGGNYYLEAKLQSRDKYSKRLMDLLGVKYFIFSSQELDNPFQFPILSYPTALYPKIFDDGKYAVFINGESLPRVKVYYSYIVAAKENTLAALFADDFDIRKSLILNKDPGFKKGELGGLGSASIARYTPNEIEVLVASQKSGLLFLSDNYYPGWKAWVNGEPTVIYSADYTFRAVKVKGGESRVVFRYQPESFNAGLRVSVISFLILLFSLIIFKIKQR